MEGKAVCSERSLGTASATQAVPMGLLETKPQKPLLHLKTQVAPWPPNATHRERAGETRGEEREGQRERPAVHQSLGSDFQWAIKWTYGRERFMKREERKTRTDTVKGTRGPLMS